MSDDSDILEAHTASKRSRSKSESACRPTQLMKQEQKACTRKGMIDKEEAKKMDPVAWQNYIGKWEATWLEFGCKFWNVHTGGARPVAYWDLGRCCHVTAAPSFRRLLSGSN